jgi:hypothetical protein
VRVTGEAGTAAAHRVALGGEALHDRDGLHQLLHVGRATSFDVGTVEHLHRQRALGLDPADRGAGHFHPDVLGDRGGRPQNGTAGAQRIGERRRNLLALE